MRGLTIILIVSIISCAAYAQGLNQGRLYSGSSKHVTDNEFSTANTVTWTHVDDFVVQSDFKNFPSFERLATHLTTQFHDERSKVRSIYTWIALNISYDQNVLLHPEKGKQKANEVWRNRVAVCEGYANLFYEMCNAVGLESRVVKGYVKNFAREDLSFPNHAWNSVKIDGKWHLLDVTWASVDNEYSLIAGSEMRNGYVQRKLNNFFLTDPDQMILTHLPEDPYWQLQNNYVAMEAFQKGEDHIKSVLNGFRSEERDFEALIQNYENLDSLDRSISYLERMEQNKWNKTKEYGLGIAYYYKAQKILKQAAGHDRKRKMQLAKAFYKKSLEQLDQLRENDFGYQFSRDLVDNVTFRMEVLQ